MIVLTGPTAIGKSDVAVELALRHNGEIISADSMQIYRGCDIGTGKIQPTEMRGVPHHLIDILNPNQAFTAQDFRRLADEAIKEITSKGKLPIVVGGTVFYIKSLLYNYDFGFATPNQEVRDKYNKLLEAHGSNYIYNLLKEQDAESANTLHPNDTKRIIRALEILEVSGIKKSQLNSGNEMRYSNAKVFYLNTDRTELYNRINARVGKMFKFGIVDEAKNLIKYRHCNSMQAIGYKEIFPYLQNDATLDDTVELLKKNSRNYAKRQLTFCKSIPNITEIHIKFPCTMSDIVARIENNIVLCQA